ncbi:MAG: hypothetical protein KatS3mg110_3637 [Pirellulaceae bacterium]|nr:MAG: hypothetical protein KatS3mg110_3637 [Pirellulaceae bacterium]
MVGGKWVVGFLLTLGLVAGVVAWWFRYQQTRRSLDYWGSEAASVIQRADSIELQHLVAADALPTAGAATANASADFSELFGRRFVVAFRRDVTRAAGILHVRDALLSDESFLWDKTADALTASIDRLWVLVFRRGDEQVHVAVVPGGWRIAGLPDRPWLDATPKAALWQKWFSEQGSNQTEDATHR